MQIELEAIEKVIGVIREFDREAQMRILSYVASWSASEGAQAMMRSFGQQAMARQQRHPCVEGSGSS